MGFALKADDSCLAILAEGESCFDRAQHHPSTGPGPRGAPAVAGSLHDCARGSDSLAALPRSDTGALTETHHVDLCRDCDRRHARMLGAVGADQPGASGLRPRLSARDAEHQCDRKFRDGLLVHPNPGTPDDPAERSRRRSDGRCGADTQPFQLSRWRLSCWPRTESLLRRSMWFCPSPSDSRRRLAAPTSREICESGQ
jgi:hypothetical protein